VTRDHAANYRDSVPPLAPGVPRPTWSIMIPTYNCARYVSETLRGVIAQDQGPDAMQIEVVDDCSNDGVEHIVQQIGLGRVAFHRQPARAGHIANFQTCLLRSRGAIIHLLHGDDVVRPGFYKALETGFKSSPEAGAAFCRSAYMDEAGITLSTQSEEQPVAGLLDDALVRLASEQRIMTPSIAVRRCVYECLGGFDRRLKCSEDWEMWVRIAANFAVWYEPMMLACYRMHKESNTGRHMRDAEDMAFTRKAIDLFTAYLPPELRTKIAGNARRTYATASLDNARQMLQQREFRGCLAQLTEAFRFRPSVHTAARIAKLLLTGGSGLARQ
jgi:glycosyltransferase involved in cell wall biosynthesis